MKNQKTPEQLETNHQIRRPFINLKDASTYLGLSKSTLYSYTHKRVIPFYKLRGRKVYFKIEDLDNFILNETNLCKSQEEIENEALNHIISK